MFCQNCGAELRLEAGFCAVCGASAPRPVLRQEAAGQSSKQQRLVGSALPGASPTPSAAPQPDPRQIHSFQTIRQASGQRGGMRALPPVASLAVPASLPEQAEPPTPEQPPQAWPAPAAAVPIAALSAPVVAPAQPNQSNGHAPDLNAIPAAPEGIQLSLNDYQPVVSVAPGANGHLPTIPLNGNAAQHINTAALFADYTPTPATRAASAPASGIHLPADIPNRLALAALASMLLSFFLPWVIIGGTRATPLSIGWPVIVPLALILAVGATILLPERTLYTRFSLALPFASGCFALGGALVIFFISSAIAANTVGVAFLGVDIGFILFTLAAVLLASAGYFKLLRELPLLYSGQIILAPLPGMLGRGAANAATHAPAPASAASGEISERRGPSA